MPGRLSRVPDVVWRRTSRHVVVAAPGGGLVEVGDLGALVWDALADPVDLGTLTADVAEAFGVSHDAAGGRLGEVLAELTAHGLVHET